MTSNIPNYRGLELIIYLLIPSSLIKPQFWDNSFHYFCCCFLSIFPNISRDCGRKLISLLNSFLLTNFSNSHRFVAFYHSAPWNSSLINFFFALSIPTWIQDYFRETFNTENKQIAALWVTSSSNASMIGIIIMASMPQDMWITNQSENVTNCSSIIHPSLPQTHPDGRKWGLWTPIPTSLASLWRSNQ